MFPFRDCLEMGMLFFLGHSLSTLFSDNPGMEWPTHTVHFDSSADP